MQKLVALSSLVASETNFGPMAYSMKREGMTTTFHAPCILHHLKSDMMYEFFTCPKIFVVCSDVEIVDASVTNTFFLKPNP